MKKCGLFLLLFIQLNAWSQQGPLKGRVVAADNKAPVVAASVFVTNTSMGTSTNTAGEFILGRLPSEQFDLVISSIGFETEVRTLDPQHLPAFLSIELKPKAKDLGEVVVEPFEKDGWATWGRFFLEKFLGTSSLAYDCRIVNTEVIHFRNRKKQNRLEAVADEALIIENKSLGYRIQFQLEKFDFDFGKRQLLYVGYPLFSEMEGSNSRKKRWAARREETYYGSQMHFMRALFRNKLKEEGFVVRKLVKIPNSEKLRVKAVMQARMRAGIGLQKLPKDTTEYYSRVLRMPDSVDQLRDPPLPGDSIAYALNKTTAALAFDDYLDIIYTKKKESMAYLDWIGEHRRAAYITSDIFLLNKRELAVVANGNFYSPADLLNLGYWAWWEKIATMLPFDYSPSGHF